MLTRVHLIDMGVGEMLRCEPLHPTEPPDMCTTYDLFRKLFGFVSEHGIEHVTVSFYAVEQYLGGGGHLALEGDSESDKHDDVLALAESEGEVATTPMLVTLAFTCERNVKLSHSSGSGPSASKPKKPASVAAILDGHDSHEDVESVADVESYLIEAAMAQLEGDTVNVAAGDENTNVGLDVLFPDVQLHEPLLAAAHISQCKAVLVDKGFGAEELLDFAGGTDILDASVAHDLQAVGALESIEPQPGNILFRDLVEQSAIGLRLLGDWMARRDDVATETQCSLIMYRRASASSGAASSSSGETFSDYVHLVGWQNVNSLFGRVFVEDEHGRLKWSVPVLPLFKLQSFARCHMILPNAGVSPVKPKYVGRPDVPPDTLRMKRMWMSALRGVSVEVVTESEFGMSLSPCQLCDSGGGELCAVCLCTVHRDKCLLHSLNCKKRKAEILRLVVARKRQIEMPDSFGIEVVCLLCRLLSCGGAASLEVMWAELVAA